MMKTEFDPRYETRDLSPDEIQERTALHLQLAKEHSENLASIAVRRKEIRTLNVEQKKLDVRSAQVLREITSGKVSIPRQQTLGMDLSVSDPFGAMYVMARDAETLHAQLAVVCQGVLVPSISLLQRWPVGSGIFDNVAHWARVELAHMNRKEHPDLAIPNRLPMPEKLAALRQQLADPPGKKRAHKTRAAKVRPASGTPSRIRRGAR